MQNKSYKMTKRTHENEIDPSNIKKRRRDEYNDLILRLKNFINANDFNNIWHTEFIDDFRKMTAANQNIDWIFTARVLEVASKIYSLRVDSLFDDVMKTSKVLKPIPPKKQNNNQVTRKVIRRNGRNKCADPASLNKSLETIPIQNIITRQFSSVVEKTSNMLTNVLDSSGSKLIIPGNNSLVWDSNPYFLNNTEIDTVLINDINLENAQVQLSLASTGSDLSAATDEEETNICDLTTCSKNDSGFNDLLSCNLSAINSTFTSTQHEDISMGDDFQESSQPEDVPNESGLSMMPSTCEQFDYSYLSKEAITNRWAGPSYWKFHQNSSQSHDCENVTEHSSVRKHKNLRDITLDDAVRENYYDTTRDNSNRDAVIRPRAAFHTQNLPKDSMIPANFVDNFSVLPNIEIGTLVEEPLLLEEHETDYIQNTMDEAPTQDPVDTSMNIIFPLTQGSMNKNVNMKTIKSMIMRVLKENLTETNGMLFSEVVKKTSHISTALCHFAIMHLLNENKVEIYTNLNNIDNYSINLK